MAIAIRIEVVRPFALRLGRGSKRREFSVGLHEVSAQELDHWFMRAAIKDGLARVVPAPAPAAAPETKEAAVKTADAPEIQELADVAISDDPAPTKKGKGK